MQRIISWHLLDQRPWSSFLCWFYPRWIALMLYVSPHKEWGLIINFYLISFFPLPTFCEIRISLTEPIPNQIICLFFFLSPIFQTLFHYLGHIIVILTTILKFLHQLWYTAITCYFDISNGHVTSSNVNILWEGAG